MVKNKTILRVVSVYSISLCFMLLIGATVYLLVYSRDKARTNTITSQNQDTNLVKDVAGKAEVSAEDNYTTISDIESDSSEVNESSFEIVEDYSSSIVFKKVIFGHSVSGREITGYEIGDGADCLFLFGSIHGNEMGSGDLLNKLVESIKNDNSLVGTNMKIIILPISNPDGYYDRTDKLNAHGVNLNLNFATSGWMQYGPEGQYAGSEAFSEPESRIIRDIVLKYQPTRLISYHAKGGFVNPEYGTQASINLAKWYANISGYEYYDDPAYDYFGTATKWFEETTSKAAITIEISSYTGLDWNMNKNALYKLIS